MPLWYKSMFNVRWCLPFFNLPALGEVNDNSNWLSLLEGSGGCC